MTDEPWPLRPPGVDDRLFDPWTFPANPAVVTQMRADVAARLPEYKQPTPDQWKMILSETPSTYVIAGAGSGKSTTLVLRILFLHHYLGYELDAMTVVTFTNMSRWDFAHKLQEVFALWNITVTRDAAKALVCTFHSKILSFVRGLPEMDRVIAFENVKEKGREDPDDTSNESLFETRISDDQRILLKACYSDLYAKNERFRGLIQILWEQAHSLRSIDANSNTVKKTASKIADIAERDASCADAVEMAWREAGMWPMAGITAQRESIQVHGHPFQIHGRIPSLGIAVVLGARVYPGKDYTRPAAEYELVKELISKQRLFQAYCPEKVIWLEDPASTPTFIQWLADKATIAPALDYQIEGDMSSKDLLECFVGAAGFIENLGLEVVDTVSKMSFQKGHVDGVVAKSDRCRG